MTFAFQNISKIALSERNSDCDAYSHDTNMLTQWTLSYTCTRQKSMRSGWGKGTSSSGKSRGGKWYMPADEFEELAAIWFEKAKAKEGER